MQLLLSTPHQSFPPVQVEEVTIPTVCGETMILPGHARLVTQLIPGILTYRSHSESKSHTVQEGIVEVFQDQITILCDELT